MSDVKRISLIKPTVETPFHIDFDWWKNHDNNWRVFLFNCLCAEHQDLFKQVNDNNWVDWIDPVTAEVHQVDGLQYILITHCAKQPGFITSQSVLVDAVFRTFLANGNTPTSIDEIGKQIGKSTNVILRTLSGSHVYKGIRPIQKL